MTRKLDKEHLDEITKLQQDYADVSRIMGNNAIERLIAERQLQQLQQTESELMDEFEKLRTAEQHLISKLKERYGDGQINIADGTFTPDN